MCSSDLIVVFVEGPGLKNGSAYALSFVLRNNYSEQASPKVSVLASVRSGVAPFYSGVGVYEAMTKPGSSQLGVAGGADPLRVHVPGFLIRTLGQSNPLASASNVLTLTIVPNCEVSPGSNVTLVGLTGSATEDTMSLDVSSGDQGWFLSTGE